jgi:hypothetical protein
MMKIVTTFRQRVDFGDEKIKAVKLELNAWNAEWIALVCKEGMTNYTHCTISGHVVYYLRLLHNYYRYSNQGWGSFNSQYRYIYCHRTQMGGSSGTNGEASKKKVS